MFRLSFGFESICIEVKFPHLNWTELIMLIKLNGLIQFLLGNFIAVGTMDPHIEIWDLDVVDTLESVITLGKKPRKKKKKKKPVATTPNDGHKDAVLGLSWNHNARYLLSHSR